MVIVAFFLFCVLFFILSEALYHLRPIPLTGLLPLALASFIALESLVLNGLSLFHAVNKIWMLIVHLSLVALWLSWVWKQDTKRPLSHLLLSLKITKKFFLYPGYQLFLPLLILIGLSAWLYPPNNYDSLTYHMARVAHWIQNSSIAYYPTPIERQNVMSPGAEYLILFFQLLSETDYLASFIQFLSYIILIISLTYIVRIVHIPKSLSPYIIILSATAPIAIMQASNTKNDLVASVMVFAILIACARIIAGKIDRMKKVDYALAGISVACGFLVKATSLLVAFPILVVAGCFQLPTLLKNRQNIKKCLIGSLIAGAIFCLIAGPDIYRKIEHHVERYEIYPLFSGYDIDRLWNPIRVLVHNIPFPDQARLIFSKMGVKGHLITKDVYNLHEDMVGNPYQVSAFIALSITSLLLSFIFIYKAAYRKKLFLALSPMASWVLFGLVVKDQGWITRLEIPLFFMLPFSLIFMAALSRKYWLIRIPLYLSIALLSFSSLAYALLVASKVPARPLVLSYFWGEKLNRESAYYNNANLKEEHDYFLRKVDENKCNRIGLILGPDSVDYPLTWRLMKRGIRVGHAWEQIVQGNTVAYRGLVDELNLSCMLYVASGSVEHVPRKGEQWLSAGDYHTFIRNSEWDFNQSEQTCLRIDSRTGNTHLKAQHDVQIEIVPDSISLLSEGNDSQLILPVLEKCDAGQAVMRLEMWSPIDSVAQVFYMTKENKTYTEKLSISRDIVRGENKVYFPIPLGEISDPLRIDIGREPGRYEILSLEIRAVQTGTVSR